MTSDVPPLRAPEAPRLGVAGLLTVALLVALAAVTAGNVAAAAAAALAGTFLAAALVRPSGGAPRGPATWAVAAALVACAVTLVPLPQAVRAAIAPGPTRARSDLHALGLQSSWAPITVDVSGTVQEALLWSGAGALLVLLSGPRACLPAARLAFALLLGLQGVAWADWVAGTRLLPLTSIEDPWNVGQASLRGATHSGWLINRNHWAALGLLLVPLGAGWAVAARPAWVRAGAGILALAAAGGIVATRSRSGTAGLGLEIVAALAFLGWRSGRRGVRIGVGVLALAGAVAIVAVAPRLRGAVGEDATGRRTLYPAVARMAVESPLLGWGPGSFREAFPAYQPESLQYAYSHAHCDPLEVVVGGGLLGLATIAGLGAVAVRHLRDASRSARARLFWSLGVGGTALVSLVEFPLQIPAVRFAWLAALFSGPALCDAVHLGRRSPDEASAP